MRTSARYFTNFLKNKATNSFNAFNRQEFRNNFAKQVILLTGIHLTWKYATQKLNCEEEAKSQEELEKELKQKFEEEMRKRRTDSMKNLQRYEVCNSVDIKEGQIYPFQVKDGENGTFEVVIVRYNGKLYCVGGIDTYDGKSKLKDGICFGNKLYSPMNGSAFNIENGHPELAPAIDELPRFFVEEKNGKVILYAPKIVPKRLIPAFASRDINDVRKVVVIGAGPAALGAIESLRLNGFTGEIIMITKGTKMPYDKTKLTKSFKFLNYDNLTLRDEDWFDSHGVNYMLGREVTFVDKTHNSPHILLEDGLKLEYDSLIIATGVKPEVRNINGIQEKDNVSFLYNLDHHKKVKQYLEKAKTITILGNNMRAMECVSTIRREYPHIKIYVIDENEDPVIKTEFGEEIYKKVIDTALDNKVKFVMRNPVDKIVGDNGLAKKIQFRSGLSIDTDFVLLMPNNFKADNDFLLNNDLDQFEFDDIGRVRCDYDIRTDYKRMFAPGSGGVATYFAANDRYPHMQWNTAYHQGMTAGYNTLALNIPWHQIPFEQYEIFGKVLQHIGYANVENEVYIQGDVQNWDFVAFHAWEGEILAVTGTPSQSKRINILNEAIRLELMPHLIELKKGYKTIEQIEQEIRESKRSTCFKNLIYELRDKPNPHDVIWFHRERQSRYFNFWEEGVMPDQNYAPPTQDPVI
ncbi:hypothetical protein ABPG74_015455 [Tetrahymena malaccensis]